MVLCLGEVFRVIYKGRDVVKPEQQLGTIKIQSKSCNEYLYKVEDIDMGRPLIKPGDSITLMGPTKGAFGSGAPFIINVDLFGGAYKDTIYHGHLLKSVALLEKRIISEDGTGEIYVLYSLFSRATEAHIEVLLSDEAAAAAGAVDSYGVIAASISKIDRPGFSSLLFESGHSINVGLNGQIPLLRSIVAVPLRSHLFVDIHLRSGSYNEIGKGTLVFDVEPGVACQKILKGKKGDIHVKVTWKDVPGAKGDIYVSSPEGSEVSEDRSHFVPSPEAEEESSSVSPQGNDGGSHILF